MWPPTRCVSRTLCCRAGCLGSAVRTGRACACTCSSRGWRCSPRSPSPSRACTIPSSSLSMRTSARLPRAQPRPALSLPHCSLSFVIPPTRRSVLAGTRCASRPRRRPRSHRRCQRPAKVRTRTRTIRMRPPTTRLSKSAAAPPPVAAARAAAPVPAPRLSDSGGGGERRRSRRRVGSSRHGCASPRSTRAARASRCSSS